MMRLSVLLLLSGTEVGRLVVQHLLLLLCVQAATAADSVNTTNRVRKASPARLHHIQQLIEHEAERQQTLLQDDAVLMDDLPALPPSAERNANELTANRHHFDDFFQGDVDLTDQQVDAIELTLNASSSSPSTTITTAAASVNENDALATRRAKRKIGAEPFYRRWPKRKPITFDFASSIPQSTRAKIRSAMLLWQYQTCVRFEEGGSSVDRIEFFDGGGCSSFVGRVGGVQGISIATPGCDDVGIISHEIGHALGVFHEQARVDQPENIRVNYQNVPLSKWNNFQPVAAHQINDFALPYDTGSVMHYGAYGFAADPYVPTIRTVDKGQQQTIGQRVGPSFLDVQAINLAYKCQELCDSHVPPVDCQYGGYPHPNDCTRCLCPDGLKGRTCNLAEQTDTCGGELELSDQIGELQLTSPNHRGHFKAGTVCSWIVKAPIGQRIVLDLDPDVDFDCGDVCDHSFLEIKHRADFRLTGSRICCSPPPQRRFVSERETMLIRLVGMRHSRRGFSAMLSLQSWTHSQRRETTRKARRRFTTTTTAAASTTTPETTTEDRDTEETTVSWPTLPAPETIPTNEDCTQCTGWAAWSTQCSQDCGGCGHRSRQRRCSGDQTKQCQETEKRMCNEAACPTGTNFLLNNHEFHILWNGCCVGLFRAGNQCAALQNGQKMLEFGKIGAAHLPVLFAVVFILNLASTYIFAIYRGDVDPLFPYISSDGDFRPESCIFSALLSLASFLVMLIAYLRWSLVGELTRGSDERIDRINFWSLVAGLLAGSAMYIVANFQESALWTIHISAAITCFAFGVIYMLMQMHPLYNNHVIGRVRLVLAILGGVFFIGGVVFGKYAGYVWHQTYPTLPIPRPWSSKLWEPGYDWHCYSALCEWSVAIVMICFVLSFAREFEKLRAYIAVEALVSHLDHSPLRRSLNDLNQY